MERERIGAIATEMGFQPGPTEKVIRPRPAALSGLAAYPGEAGRSVPAIVITESDEPGLRTPS